MSYSTNKMQIVTINLPDDFITTIKQILDKGDYPSRSEVIRIAIRDQLKEDLAFYKTIHTEDPSLCKSSR